jgi:hypothetical protein
LSQRQIRWIGSAIGFALADVWVVAGLTAALVCAVAGAAGYGAVVAGQRHALTLARRQFIELRRRVELKFAPPKAARRPRVRVTETPTAETTYGW